MLEDNVNITILICMWIEKELLLPQTWHQAMTDNTRMLSTQCYQLLWGGGGQFKHRLQPFVAEHVLFMID